MDETQIQQYLETYAEKWLNLQKDTLLLQLVGFIMDKKAELEKEIGSGEVQKIFAEEEQQQGEWVEEVILGNSSKQEEQEEQEPTKYIHLDDTEDCGAVCPKNASSPPLIHPLQETRGHLE